MSSYKHTVLFFVFFLEIESNEGKRETKIKVYFDACHAIRMKAQKKTKGERGFKNFFLLLLFDTKKNLLANMQTSMYQWGHHTFVLIESGVE